MEASSQPAGQPPHLIQKVLENESFLMTMITTMTILTAVAAFQSALAGGESLKYFFMAQSKLTNASSLYVERGQELFYDQSVYDQYQIALLGGDEAAASYFYNQLSDAGVAAVDRSVDAAYPFDEAYEEVLFAMAKAESVEADVAFDLAGKFNQKGDRLGLVTTILAVGLAFAAWASLAVAGSRTRFFFSLFGLLSLLLAAGEYVRILMT